MIRLITGYAGVGHVTSADAGRFNAGICGNDAYIMQTGEQMAYTLNSNNEITIGSGDLVNQGRHFSIPQNSSETLSIENGSQGKARCDAVVIRYSKDTGTGVESASMHIVKGTEVASTQDPPKPEVNRGNIFNGEIADDVILYYIKIVELNVDSVTPAVPVIHSLTTIADVIYPVGSIYMSMNKTSPAVLFGGEWQQITGSFLFPYTGVSGQTGGEHFITLTEENLPSHAHYTQPHTHNIPSHTHTATMSSAGTHTHTFDKNKAAGSGTARYVPEDAGGIQTSSSGTVKTSQAGAHTHSIKISATSEMKTVESSRAETSSVGKGKAFNNMPPYITVYAWYRIS